METLTDTVIETQAVMKRYGNVTAVDGVSLHVGRGEIYAFLGLNGAGKTTTVRLLLGMVRPTSGEVYVLGRKIRLGERGPWEAVGYLVETADAYPELTVRENLEAVRRLRPGVKPAAVGRALEQLGLAGYADRRAGTLSLGNSQRLGLAKALLHKPRLLLLDEPANGLDPAGIVEIRSLLLTMAKQDGVTVFLCSHILAEVSRLAQRIGIIHQGRLLQELDVNELERNRKRRLVVRARDGAAAQAALAAAGFAVRAAPGGALAIDDAAALDRPEDISTRLVQAGCPPIELKIEEEDLEGYFLRLVGMGGESPP